MRIQFLLKNTGMYERLGIMTLDVGRPLTKLERARSEGILPTSSSLYSFTNPPNPTHNRSPCFSQVRRLSPKTEAYTTALWKVPLLFRLT